MPVGLTCIRATRGEQMRILLINDHSYFGGGGDAVLILERELLRQRGHEVFTYAWGADPSEDEADGRIIAPEPKTRVRQRLAKFLGNGGMRRHFRKALARIRPDVIHLHLVSKYPLAVYPELRGYPTLQTLHGPNLFCISGWGNHRRDCSYCPLGIGWKCFKSGCCSLSQTLLGTTLNRRIHPWLGSVINEFHSPSMHLCETVTGLGFENVKYIPLGIDRCFYEQPIAPWPRARSIFFIGALAEQKGVDILLDAFAEVAPQVPDAKLRIAGRGVLQPLLERKIRTYGLQNQVELLGFVNRENALRLYRESMMVVMPSVWWEQFGMVIPESLASGTPVIGAAVGGIREQLADTSFGFLVPPRDPRALAEKILRLLRDPDEAKRAGESAREFILNKHDPEKYVTALEQEMIQLREKKKCV